MKIKLSPYWWRNLYGQLGVYLLFIIYYEYKIGGEGAALIKVFEPKVYYLLHYFLPILLGIFFLDAALHPKKFLMVINVEAQVFRSSLFGKVKCEVYRNRQIYYAIFNCKESNFSGIKRYFAISNTPFVCEERRPTLFSANRFIDYYDPTKQIMLPYDEETEALIDFDNWISVN